MESELIQTRQRPLYTKMIPPKSVRELKRFMGKINQLCKFTSNLDKIIQSFYKFLSLKKYVCGDQHSQMPLIECNKSSQDLSHSLFTYDPNSERKISADAPSHGLRVVLMQKADGTWN